MKTKIIFFTFIFSIMVLFGGNSVFALSQSDSVLQDTAGVSLSSYQVTWCSPHYNETELNVVFHGTNCKNADFYKVGNNGYLTYNGTKSGSEGILKTQIHDVGSGTTLKNLFNVDTLYIEGEGTYTINVVLQDFAGNTSIFPLVYNIDKTAPKFVLNSIIDNSEYTYTGISTKSQNVNINDSTNKYSQNFLSVDNYGDISTKSNTINNLKTLYFSRDIKFGLNIDFDDTYGSKPNISGNGYIKIVDGTTETILNISNLNTSILKTGNIILRAYDKAGNYSEQAFYAYYDTKTPTLDVTGITNDSYIAAINNKELLFSLSDSVGGAGISSNNKVMIEKSTDKNIKKSYDINGSKIIHDFSKVDNDLTNQQYRIYSFDYTNNCSESGKVCDNVCNCSAPSLKSVNVVSNIIDDEKSKLNISTSDTKVYGDNASYYSLELSLKDTYENLIRSVNNVKELKIDIVKNGNGIFTSSGLYIYNVKSNKPTSGSYPYIADNKISLNSIKTEVINNLSHSLVGEYPAKSYGFNDLSSIKLITTENLSFFDTGSTSKNDFKNENDILTKYGEVTINSGSLSFSEFSNYKPVSFEFASPVLYGGINFSLSALNFNQAVGHGVKFYNLASVPTPIVNEQYLVKYGGDKHVPNIVDFKINGVPKNDLHTVNTSQPQNVVVERSTVDLLKYNTQYGYVSYIKYKLGADTITLPSISRGISDSSKNVNSKLASEYYPGNYVIIGDGLQSVGIGSELGIAITGLANTKNNPFTNSTGGTSASLTVGQDLTRYDLIKTFKENVKNTSAGIIWCNGQIISDLNTDIGDCTTTINGEKISFIKGDVQIGNGSKLLLNDNTKRTIIVKDGYVYIKSNISTYNNHKNNGAQLLIGSITDAGLENINIDNSGSLDIASEPKVKGWTFIDPDVTNIDAYIVSQGPMVSYSGSDKKIFTFAYENELRNQLHIYGSVLSLNTIGGFNKDPDSAKCPYIISNCNSASSISQAFDLTFIRRYKIVDPKTYDMNYYGTGFFIPYLTQSNHGAYRSGKLEGPFELIGTTDSECNNDLRCIKDVEYKKYPLFIERDTLWNNSPSVMFIINN